MQKIIIDSDVGSSVVYVGYSLKDIVPPGAGRRVILTDQNVYQIYGPSFPDGEVIVINPGEGSKTLSQAEEVIRQMIHLGVDRSWSLVGIGGGVICDISGIIGSLYMRGIPFGFISTTLLSQADASIGGKNGVNVDDKKNVVGLFNNPDFVICDSEMINTLSDVEFRSGMGEIIKYAIIGDPGLFDTLKKEYKRILARDKEILSGIIYSTILIKKRVVEADFKESGIRRLLNFGHTLGHALELHGGFRHGVAVATGMAFAVDVSVKIGILGKDVQRDIGNLLSLYGLSPCVKRIESDSIKLIGSDKKRVGESIDFVLIDGIGSALTKSIPLAEIEQYAKEWKPE